MFSQRWSFSDGTRTRVCRVRGGMTQKMRWQQLEHSVGSMEPEHSDLVLLSRDLVSLQHLFIQKRCRKG